MTRVLHLSTGGGGGAARAARTLHRALLDHGLDSELWEARPTLGYRIAAEADRRLWSLQRSPVRTWRSPAVFGTLGAGEVNRSGADIVNLHWVTNGYMTVRAVGGIRLPVAWSMVDLWPVSGTEHYPPDSATARFRTGYLPGNRPPGESGFDLDRWTWARKRRSWSPMHLVPASRWLESCIRGSALAATWPLTRIPHVVDTAVFTPMDRARARAQLGLPATGALVGFLSSAGTGDLRKGWDLLEAALAGLTDATAVIVGPLAGEPSVAFRHLGEIDGDASLRALYAACDVIAVPSRDDTMPLVALEAQSCGVPVVAFRIGGLPDIVVDGSTGLLVEPFSIDGLRDAIAAVLSAPPDPDTVRHHAESTWSPAVIAGRYAALYAGLASRG